MAARTNTTDTAPEFANTGENVKYRVEGDQLTIVIDLSHRGGLSASGKTVRVGTTNGNKEIGDTGVVLGLNAYVYANPR